MAAGEGEGREVEKESRADVPCGRSPPRGRLCNLEGRAGSVMEKFYPTGLGLESGPAQVSLAAVSRREFSRLGLPTARSFLLDDESGS